MPRAVPKPEPWSRRMGRPDGRPDPFGASFAMRDRDPPVSTSRFQAWPRHGLIGLVRGYRLLLSPWLGSSCRFEPTCSAYALVALERHGARRGGVLTLGRIARCHPWCAGGHDPVPDQSYRLFSSFRKTSL